MRRFDDVYKFGPNDRGTAEVFERRLRDIDDRIHVLEDVEGSFQEKVDALIDGARATIDANLLPTFERMQQYQSGGHLTVALEDFAVTFEPGATSIGIPEASRAFFAPGPFVTLTRTSTVDDYAVAQVLGWNAETGVLDVEILSAVGDDGPHEDVAIWSDAVGAAALLAFIDEAKAIRDAALDSADAASTSATAADGSADAAAASASAASGSADAAAASVVSAAAQADAASDSADAAAASAALAATFNPSNYYTKTQVDTELTGLAAADLSLDGRVDAIEAKVNDGGTLEVRVDAVESEKLAKAGDTMTGQLVLPASLISAASLRVPHGTAPTSPSNGDVWSTSAGLFVRVNGVTIGPLGPTATRTIFNASGTFSKRSDSTFVLVELWGAGGGGGGGRRGALSTARYGGAGGGGGAYVYRLMRAQDLASSVTVTIGAGGTAGAAATANDTNGGNGGSGGASTFGTHLTAYGGGGGVGGSTAPAGSGAGGGTDGAGNGVTAGAGPAGFGGAASSTTSGNPGGFGGASGGGGTGAGGSAPFGGAGGGAGGYITAGNAYSEHSAGGASQGLSGGAGGAGGVTGGFAGSAGGSACGGGGGGPTLNGFNSGAGGVGGAGRCIVYEW